MRRRRREDEEKEKKKKKREEREKRRRSTRLWGETISNRAGWDVCLVCIYASGRYIYIYPVQWPALSIASGNKTTRQILPLTEVAEYVFSTTVT